METAVGSAAIHSARPIAPQVDGGDIPDYEASGVPLTVAAALEAMRFCNRSTNRVRTLPSKDWQHFLTWTEARQVALTIAGLWEDGSPARERTLLARSSEAFRARMLRIREALREIALALGEKRISFVVLKGFTHAPDLTPNPLWRAQGDIDIWCRGPNATAAFDALLTLGYVPTASHSKRHLPPLARSRHWKWDGNLAAIPISVEIHERLWEEGAGYAGAPDEVQIWHRTSSRTFHGDTYRVLRTDDLISFAAFHLFLHLANGDLPLQRAWEIANFLQSRADDDCYWGEWDASHSARHWVVELLVFRLVQKWFNCRLPEPVVKAASLLPEDTRFWLAEFAFEPLKAQSDSNKNYFWLNWSLLNCWKDRLSAARRCFIPIGLPGFVDRSNDSRPESGARRLVRQRRLVLSRAKHHLAGLNPTLNGGLIWIGHKCGLERGFLPFLMACALFDIGEFVFVILFNFYLLEIGLREDAIGFAVAGMSAGTLIGTPIATFVAHRFGLRNGLVIGALGCGLATLLRIAFTGGPALVLFAVSNGICFSFWAVAFIPAIAGLSCQRHRSLAYGLATSLGISIGIVAGPVATRLPAVLHTAFALGSLDAKRAVLCMGSAFVALAALPALSLRVGAPRNERPGPSVMKGPFILLFVAGVLLWTLATGPFNTFFTPFFSLRIGLSMVQIGMLFAIGQAVQVAATLAAPLLVRRIGEARHVVFTVVATAAMLLLLAGTAGRVATACLYLGYVAFQYANEPSLFAWLMNRVSSGERTRASGVLFIVMSAGGMLSAAVSGKLIAHSGYTPVLCAAASLAIVAAAVLKRASRQSSAID
ncbi:MAG: MFS transporter [Bryobacteraceae bacterium]